MSFLYNRARVSTATAGTGTMTLGAATSAAFFTFAEAGVPDGTVVSYVIEDGTNVELGVGTYTSAGTTLSRTVTASKISGTAGTTKLTLSGSAIVYIDALAADITVPPASSTDKAIARFSGTSGRAIQDSSLVTLSDVGLFQVTGNDASRVGYGVTNTSTSGSAGAGGHFISGTQADLTFEANHAQAWNSFYANVGRMVFYTIGTDPITFGTHAIDAMNLDSSQNLLVGGSSNSARRLQVLQDSATTNAITYVERLTSTSSGTPAVGIGVGQEFEVETSAGVNCVGATIETTTQLGTAGSEILTLNAKQMAAGALQEPFGLSFFEKVITSNVGYTSNNSVQPWFPSGGAITLEGSTTYEFEGLLAVQTTGASTTHTTGLSFTGTATLTSIAYNCESHFQLANTTMSTSSTTLSNRTYVNQASNTTVSGLSGTTSAQQQLIWVRGIIRVNGAGTVIPNFTFSAGPGAGNVLANTFFKLRKLGSNTVVNQGNWA